MSWVLPHVEEFDGQEWQQEASWEGRKVHEGQRLSHVPLPQQGAGHRQLDDRGMGDIGNTSQHESTRHHGEDKGLASHEVEP